jgi:hypothetical protein
MQSGLGESLEEKIKFNNELPLMGQDTPDFGQDCP